MGTSPEPAAGRRSYDREIDPVIETFIERRLTDERHSMRDEFTTALVALTNKVNDLASAVNTAALQSTREHAEVHAGLDELRREVAAVRETAHPLVARVVELERHDDIDHAREDERASVLKTVKESREAAASARRWVIGTCLTVIALLLTIAGAVVTSV